MSIEQRKLTALKFIHRLREKTGRSPSYDSIGRKIGYASKSGVHRLVASLEEDGLIDRGCGRRDISLTDRGLDRLGVQPTGVNLAVSILRQRAEDEPVEQIASALLAASQAIVARAAA